MPRVPIPCRTCDDFLRVWNWDPSEYCGEAETAADSAKFFKSVSRSKRRTISASSDFSLSGSSSAPPLNLGFFVCHEPHCYTRGIEIRHHLI